MPPEPAPAPNDPAPAPAPEPAPAPDPQPAPAPEPAPAPAKTERPEGLGDDFWDSENNQVKFPELLDRLNGLTAREAELDSRLAQAPEKPDGYKVELPEGFEMPEGMEFKPDPDNPLTKPAMEWAHKHGLSQAAFSELVAMQAQAQLRDNQATKEFYETETAERLGERAPQRRKAVETWVGTKLAGNKDVAQFAKQMLADPLAVLMFENVMKMTQGVSTQPRTGNEEPGKGNDLPEDIAPRERLRRAYLTAKA